MKLSNRVALVTGGSHGIGKAIVSRFLADGARVVCCAREPVALEATQRELNGAGDRLLAVQADVTQERQVTHLVDCALEAHGRIDVLVNNAGIYGPIGPAWETDPAEWEQAIRVNLLGTFLLCRHVVPHMVRAGRGKIVNIAGGGAASPLPRFSAYAASKAALVRFSETLAAELAEHNVQVNAVAPGFVATRLHRETLRAGAQAGAFLKTTEEHLAQGGVDPSVPAALVAYLASSESDGITGKFLSSIWDTWANLADRVDEVAGSDVFTLRRIVPRDRGMDWQ